MNTSIKRVMYAGLIAVMAVGLLPGCGGAKAPSEGAHPGQGRKPNLFAIKVTDSGQLVPSVAGTTLT
jgi:hypothetical protein